jgi:hypothetical protein
MTMSETAPRNEVFERLFGGSICWILGAGASYDCIAPGRVCTPLTRGLLDLNSMDKRLISAFEIALRSSPDFIGVDHALTLGLEETIDWFRKLSQDEDSVQTGTMPPPGTTGEHAPLASGFVHRIAKYLGARRSFPAATLQTSIAPSQCLAEITKAIAEQLRKDQVLATLAHGGRVGFRYCAENYLWLASMTCVNRNYSVLTLNFDTLLDRAYEEVVGYDPPPIPYIEWRNLLQNHFEGRPIPTRQGGIYLKLHGSLDLLACHNRRCERYRTPFSVRSANTATSQPHLESLGSHSRQCSVCGSACLDLILPPGRNKTRAEDNYHKMLHREASKVLCGSDTWVIVGYSLPEYDHDIIDLFNEAFHEGIAVFVVAPDAVEIAGRLRRHIRHDVYALQEGFSEFVDNFIATTGGRRPGIA